MDHQPFEQWIFEEKNKTDQQNRLLNEHLSKCPDCASLELGWQSVENQLRCTPMVSPAVGFSNRFQARLALRKQEQQQTQLMKILLGVGAAIFLTMGTMLLWLLITHSFGELIVNAVTIFTGFVQGFIRIRALGVQLFRIAPPFTPYLFWLVVAGWGIALASLWGITIWRITKQGAIQHETN